MTQKKGISGIDRKIMAQRKVLAKHKKIAADKKRFKKKISLLKSLVAKVRVQKKRTK